MRGFILLCNVYKKWKNEIKRKYKYMVKGKDNKKYSQKIIIT